MYIYGTRVSSQAAGQVLGVISAAASITLQRFLSQ